jgi:hypothetical protein
VAAAAAIAVLMKTLVNRQRTGQAATNKICPRETRVPEKVPPRTNNRASRL